MDKESTNPSDTSSPKNQNSKTVAAAQSAPAEPTPTVILTDPSSSTSEAVAAAPVIDPTTGAPVDTVVLVKPPKKKKTGLIVSIIIIVLLLLGGIGFAIWYFAVYQSPENVVFDSVNKLITAEHVSPHGSFTTTIASDNGYDVKMTVSVESSSYRLPNEASVWLMLSVYDASGEPATDEVIKLNVGTVQMTDGVAYLKIDNLTETFDQLLPNIFPPTNCTPGTNCLDAPNPIEDALYEVAELIDDQWWQISLNDILDELDMLDDWQAEVVTDIYACSVDAMNADYSDEIAPLYRRNRFINVEELAEDQSGPTGTTAYLVSLDYDALANFLNAAKRSSSTTDFYNCYNAAIDKAAKNADDYYYDAEDFEEMKISLDDMKDISASDLEKYLPEDAEIILHIDSWNHELREIELWPDTADNETLLSIAFDYSAQPEVSAPSDYRPITELFDEIGEIIWGYSGGPEILPDFSCNSDDSGLCYDGDITFPVEINI